MYWQYAENWFCGRFLQTAKKRFSKFPLISHISFLGLTLKDKIFLAPKISSDLFSATIFGTMPRGATFIHKFILNYIDSLNVGSLKALTKNVETFETFVIALVYDVMWIYPEF